MTDKKPRRRERVPCPEQHPDERIKNFDDVVLGYTKEMAMEEANRCLNCKHKPCVSGCPVSIDIPAFIQAITKDDLQEAYRILTESHPIPSVCGRVCPQEVQCEAKCVLARTGQPISIGKLERYVGDWAVENNACARGLADPLEKPAKVAMIGAGPASLACAQDLALTGIDVEIFEALHTLGGVLKYGIPSFRLPKDIIDVEIQKLQKLGVKFHVNRVIGKVFTIPQLLEEKGFDAAFIGVGAGLPRFLNIPGEGLNGVMSANEFLTRVNLMNPPSDYKCDTPMGCGKKVAVIGGGNVAMDCVRVAKRLDTEKAMIVYRRDRNEAPARVEEVHHADEEGIEFHWLSSPVEIIGEDGWVKGLRVQKMELGEPDESGRRRPKPVPGSEYVVDADTVILAIGTTSNPIIGQTTPGLKLNQWGYIETDDDQMTSIPGVFAGGDIVTGSATVILALGQGKEAANGIRKYLGIDRKPEAVCVLED